MCCTGSVFVEERYYAHYTIPSLLVHEFYITNNGTEDLSVIFETQYASASNDISFEAVPVPAGMLAIEGSINQPELPTSPQVL